MSETSHHLGSHTPPSQQSRPYKSVALHEIHDVLTPPISDHEQSPPRVAEQQVSSNSHIQQKHKEATLIRSHCPVISPTGCTSSFCASGRLNRPLDSRVGENHPLTAIENEARAFLHEMFEEDLFNSRSEFEARLAAVLEEIQSNAIETMVWQDSLTSNGDAQRVKVKGWSSSGYTQTRDELEFGIRLSWKNSRRCIMRAHYPELKLVDLRHVTTSRGMIDAIIEHAPAAFNHGRIILTVFVFPPRTVNKSGPMFWSPQLLTFAGYEMEDGSILGDRSSTQITKDIIAIGWVPPSPKTRWDILPLVVMAESDEPAMGILPKELTDKVHITHPSYPAFASLDLNWNKFPALSRLGFDIGGVQYTATPFMGWWMDAEIGVRDLADTSRYNALPSVAKAIGWKETSTPFEDLPDHERLLWLSRAQTELNYAVHHSFLKAGVNCTSTLTASDSWCAFDDQHFKEKGYRLPADPYWLAPPQGSIIPLWHRGSAPNYQPKPLITRHRFDPVKIWKRRHGISVNGVPSSIEQLKLENDHKHAHSRKVHVFFAGTGGTASKLAERLRKHINTKSKAMLGQFGCLNSYDATELHETDIILAIVATTGQGELPSNGLKFKKNFVLSDTPSNVKYAIFGLCDDSYASTFNGAAKIVDRIFQDKAITPLIANKVRAGNVAVENPPLKAFEQWWESVEAMIDGKEGIEYSHLETESMQDSHQMQHEMLKGFQDGIVTFERIRHVIGGILKLSVEINEPGYQDMGHIRLLPRNSPDTVKTAMVTLGFRVGENVNLRLTNTSAAVSQNQRASSEKVAVEKFLTDYVDLQQPFTSLEWASGTPDIENTSVMDVLSRISNKFPTPGLCDGLRDRILLAMPTLRARSYSIASSSLSKTPKLDDGCHKLDLLVRVLPDGRFSSTCLFSMTSESKIPYRLTPNTLVLPLLQTWTPKASTNDRFNRPVILIGTGTGLAPILSFLHRRQTLILSSSTPTSQPQKSTILFAGFRIPTQSHPSVSDDGKILLPKIEAFAARGLFSHLYLMPSNEAKTRVQDLFVVKEVKGLLKERILKNDALVFICGGQEMVSGARDRLRVVIGEREWERVLEEGRIICEVF